MKKYLKQKKYVGSSYSRDLFGTALAHAPTTSFSNAEVLFFAAVRSFLLDVKFNMKGIDLDKQVPLSSVPSQSKILAMIEALAVRKFVLAKD